MRNDHKEKGSSMGRTKLGDCLLTLEQLKPSNKTGFFWPCTKAKSFRMFYCIVEGKVKRLEARSILVRSLYKACFEGPIPERVPSRGDQ